MSANQVFQRRGRSSQRRIKQSVHCQRKLRLELLESRQLLTTATLSDALDGLRQDGGLATGIAGAAQLAPDATAPIAANWESAVFARTGAAAADNLSAEGEATAPFTFSANYLGTVVTRPGYDLQPSIMYDPLDVPARRYKMWWLGQYQSGDADPAGVPDVGDRIYYSFSASPDTGWSKPQVVLKGQGGLGGAITADDDLLGSPSVLKLNGKYYMFYEAFSNATVINRFYSFDEGDSWVTSGASLLANAENGDYRLGPDWDQSYAFLNYPLGFAPFMKQAGTHPVYTGEVQYTSGKLNRYVSLTVPQVGQDAYGFKWRALHKEAGTGRAVPAFWLYDDPAAGREPLYAWFDLTHSNTFVTRSLDTDDPVCELIRSGSINAVPVDLDPNTPGYQQLLGYVASSLDGPDMIGSLQNRVMMATSNDGINWTRFQGPARGGAVIAPQNELTSAQGYDLAAARRGERPHASTTPAFYWDIPYHYGSGFPSALVRDGYLEVYFSDTKSQDQPYDPYTSDVPDDPATPVNEEVFRAMLWRRVRFPVADIERSEAWDTARAPANPTLTQWANYGQDIKWSPLQQRYFASYIANGSTSLIWSEIDPDPNLPPAFHLGDSNFDSGRLPSNYPNGQPGRYGTWGGLLGDEQGHTVDFAGSTAPYSAIHMYYAAQQSAAADSYFAKDIDHILVCFWPINVAPLFTKGVDIAVAKNAGPQTIPVWAKSISPGPANESGQAVDFVVTPSYGGLFAVPPAISPSGTLTFTPEPNVSGQTTVTVRLHDNGGTSNGGSDTSASQTFIITVMDTNVAPVLGAIGGRTIAEQTPLTFTATATDPPANSLSYHLVGAPVGATMNAATGVFSWTPTEAQGPGAYTFTVKVTDNGTPALSDDEQITVTVTEVNLPPVLAAIGGQTVTEQTALTFLTNSMDADVPANLLSYSLVGAPTGATINTTSGAFSWTPTASQGAGAYTFTVKVTDNGTPALSDEEQITVRVTEVNAPPVRAAGRVASLVVPEDSGTTSLGLGSLAYGPGGGADEAGQLLSYKVTAIPPSTLGTIVLGDGATLVQANTAYSLSQIQGMQFKTAPNANGGGGAPSGLRYSYYEGDWTQLPNFDQLGPVGSGVTSNFGVGVRQRDDNFGLRFEGFIEIAEGGDYTFFTTSDDGSRLWIDGQLVVDNDGLHATLEGSGQTHLSPGLHVIRADFFERVGSEVLSVSYAGPGIAKQPIPDARLTQPNFSFTVTDNGTTNGAADPKTMTEALAIGVTAVNDPLSVRIEPAALSENSSDRAIVWVTRNNPDSELPMLTIWFSSSDASEASLQEFVWMNADSRFVGVYLFPVDDLLTDGTQRVTIKVSAAGYADGFGTIDILDDESPVDTTPPTVSGLTPADNATGVAVGTSLVMTFNENIQKGAGNILLKKTSDNSTVETIAVTSAGVTISGATATIDPATTLASSTGYYVEVAAGAFEDLSGNDFTGISGATAWNFTTSDTAPPTVSGLSPADNATGVAVGTNLVMTFSKNIQKGTGNILLKTSDNSIVETIAVTNVGVTISGVTATIDPATALASSTGYYVEVAAGAFEDLSGNDFAGISGAMAWNFTTSSLATEIRTELRIVSVPAASDHLSDANFASYASLSSVPVSSTYYAEVWVRDTGTLRGIAGGSIDLGYTTAKANATAIEHGSVYTALTSGTLDDVNGLVDNVGGGTFNAGEGTTQWVRLGTTTFQGTAAGAVTFTLGHDLSPGAANSSFAEVGAGSLDWSLVQFPAAPLTLQQVAGNVEVYLIPRLAKSAGDTSASLPTSERSPFWALEGGKTASVNDFYVEVWVRSDPLKPAGISGGSVNVSFDPRYARAAAIEHGSVYTVLPVESINNTTGVVSLGGGTLATDKGRDGYVLLGRIEFQGTAPVDEVAHQAGPYSAGLAVAAGPNSFAEVGLENVDATFKPVPAANIKPVIYDIDDSGAVDFGDFSYFVPAFGKSVGGTEPPYTWWADFDGSGTVDFGDFSYFVTAFNKGFGDPGISFPTGGQGPSAAGQPAGGESGAPATARLASVPSEIAAEVRLVASPAAGDHLSDAAFASYASVISVPLGSTYYAEVWLRDTGTIRGLAGGSLDLAYATAKADATAIDHGGVFNVLTTGTLDEAHGLVDNLGGGTFSSGEGTTQWVRLATTTFNSTGTGVATFTLGHDLPLGAGNPNFAEVGAGSIDWGLVQFTGTSLTVTATNMPPVRTAGTLTPISVLEDSANGSAVTLGLSRVTYGPGGGPDEAFQTLKFSVTRIPAYVQISKADGTTQVNVGGILTAAELQGLKYKTVANANGSGNLTWTVTDNGTTNGAPDPRTITETLAIAVTAVNDLPTSANKIVTTNEDTAFVFAPSNFTFSDADVGDTPSTEQLNAVKITRLERAGALQWNNGTAWTDVALNQVVTTPDIALGRLRFVPALNANGLGYATFGFQVQDTLGPAFSVAAYVMTIDVLSANDAPVRTAGNLTPRGALEDGANGTAVTLGLTGLSYGPGGGPDETAQKLTYTVTAIPTYVQIFKANGTTPVNISNAVTVSELAGLKYKTIANANGTGNLTWTVTDSGSGVAPNVNRLVENLSLTVSAVNDAPVRTAGTMTPIRVLEDSAKSTAVMLGLAGLRYGPGGGPDEASQTLTYTVTAIPGYVQIFKPGGTTQVNVGGTVTAAELAGLMYKTVPNANGTGNLTWTVTDSGSGTAPNVNRLTESLALVVTAVNDAPVRTAGTLTPIRVSVNSANTTAVTLGLAGLSYGPGGPDEAAQKLTYKVTAIPAYVQIFKANGTTRVNVGGSLTATDLKGLKYKTVANASGTGNLIWTVTDNGSGTAPNVNRLSESLPISVTPLLARSQAESEGAPPASAATVGSAAAGVSEAFVLPFRPWQNATLCEDVNGDSVVTALDVLVIINYLNTQGSGSLPFSPPDSSGTPKFFDVNGDGQCTPLDTLQVINFLNAAASTISGEGESLPAGDAAGLPRVAASHDRLVDAVVSEYESVDLDGLLDVLASDRVS